ncbi:hypothetical protein M9435_004132 [Picochlorum sp. BPE23]|nr:hypothetical protein M9435_004132 [Picochlorum sp. BPE23]
MAGLEGDRSLAILALFGLILYVYLVSNDVLSDLRRAKKCDTTYIYPSYEKVRLAVEEDKSTGFFFTRYSLFRYQERNSYWVPTEVTQKRNDGAFPVLFVHGHLGSYEQMRSMASETAKELSRRYRKGDNIRWVDWYAVDFDGEPSGLEPRLLVNQAKYVASCVQYLRQQAPKVVLVGYSMGGLIVDTVVEDYSDSVLFAITIGSPHFHLPSFVMPRHLYVDGSSPRVDAAVPRLRMYAGPGDVLVPAISAWSVHTSRKSNLTLEVDLDNIPGVWGTSTHKGLVSCNQLVRQTVPLILDSIDLAYEGGSPDDIYTAMRGRMTSRIPFHLKTFEENGKQVSGRPKEAQNCQELRQPFQVVMSRPGIDICFIHTLKDGDEMDLMQILAHGMHPGVAFNLYGIRNDGYFEMSHNFSPLPALSVKEPKENKRYWKDVIQGIDWMENSTWVLEVSTKALRHHGAKSVQLSIQSQVNPLLGEGIVVSFINEKDRIFRRLGELIQGAAVVKLDISSLLYRLGGIIKWFVPKQFTSWTLIADMLPIKLVLTNHSCLNLPDPQEKDLSSEPLLVLVNNDTGIDGDHFRRAANGAAKLEIPLWHPSVVSDDMYAITDPRCAYSISLAWDFYSAILYSTRHQMYAMPGLLLAFSVFRCVPLCNSRGNMRAKSPNVGRFMALSAAVAVEAVAVSRLLNAMQKGTVPWIFLQTPTSIISMLWITFLVDFIVKTVLCGFINLIGTVTWMRKLSAWFNTIYALKLAIILAMFLLHDFVPFFLACLMIFVASCSPFGSDDQSRFFPLEWFAILFYGVSPMAVAMFGGKIFGYTHRIQYSLFSLERILIGAISLSSVAVVTRRRPSNHRVISMSTVLRIFCANAALLGSLFGFNFLSPFLVALLCLGEYILSIF